MHQIVRPNFFPPFIPLCRYEAGDHVAVFPTNDPVLVDRIAELLGGKDMDTVMSLNNVDGKKRLYTLLAWKVWVLFGTWVRHNAHNVNRFTLNLHSLKIKMGENFP